MVVAVVVMRIHVAVMQQEAHMEEILLPVEVWVVPPVGVVGITVWGCGWWLILAYNIGLFSHKVPH